jgi:hypothetical protein
LIHSDRRTAGQTEAHTDMTRLIDAFRDYGNAPNKRTRQKFVSPNWPPGTKKRIINLTDRLKDWGEKGQQYTNNKLSKGIPSTVGKIMRNNQIPKLLCRYKLLTRKC